MCVHINTITNWSKSYAIKGSKELEGSKRGTRSEDKKFLTKGEEQQIQGVILDVMPDQLKLSYALWSRKEVMELVEWELEIKLGLTTMGDYLCSWGYMPQKPKKKAYEKTRKLSKDG